jgi:hypothetical protein
MRGTIAESKEATGDRLATNKLSFSSVTHLKISSAKLKGPTTSLGGYYFGWRMKQVT